jgi:Kef-type K+ transport system membrane component KefB
MSMSAAIEVGSEPMGLGKRLVGFHLATLAVTIVGCLLLARFGSLIAGTDAIPVDPAAGPRSASLPPAKPILEPMFHLLVCLATLMVVGRCVAAIFERFHQPGVMGEVVAGILLGPTVLGALWPESRAWLLPTPVVPMLDTVSALGLCFFMFIVGMEFDLGLIRRKAATALAVAHAGIALPFLLGATLAAMLFARYGEPGSRLISFALFLGAAMSVTAFPILARILRDRGWSGTALGVTALACAAADDAMAWALLAAVSGLIKDNAAAGAWVMVLSALFLGFALTVGRALMGFLARQAERHSGPTPMWTIAGTLAVVMLFAACTKWIGLHMVFGAFVAGLIVPQGSRLARELEAMLGGLTSVILLPAFFMITGMKTQITLVATPLDWFWCAMVLAVACLGKFGGAWLAGRAAGLNSRESFALGVLMNTRALMEIIIVSIGLEMGVISPTIFAMMVIMAVVTTLMTGPLINAFRLKDVFADARPFEKEPRTK